MRFAVFGVLLLVVVFAGAWFGSDGQIGKVIMSDRQAEAEGQAPSAASGAQAVQVQPSPSFQPSELVSGQGRKAVWSCRQDGLLLTVTEAKLLRVRPHKLDRS
ncbi:MAG: hypothetical protein Alpg2KO_23100 [Alphaproteobacteria bacterium]